MSRIERGIVSPTFATLRELMLAMGEEPALSGRRLPTDWDPAHMASTLARTPEERLALAVAWNRTAGRLASAGRAARTSHMTDEGALDPERIFATLDEHEVAYVVVGGIAIQVHGHVRMTNDVDLIPSPSPENLKRLAAALAALDARVLNPGSEQLKIDARMPPHATLWHSRLAMGTSTCCTTHPAPRRSPSCESGRS